MNTPADRGLALDERSGLVEFGVKAVPGASRTRVAGVHGAALKVTVSAPAEGGKANAALVEAIADWLGVRSGDVSIVAGTSTARKRVRVLGVNREGIEAALNALRRGR